MTEQSPPEESIGAVPGGGPRGGSASPPGPAMAPPVVPMRFTVLLDEAMRWTRAWLRVIYPPFAVPIAVITAVQAALQALWLRPTPGNIADPWQAIGHSCALVLLMVPILFLILVLYWAMAAAAVDAVAGRQVSYRRSLRFVLRPGVLGAQLLVTLCTMVAFACCVVPAFYVLPLLALTLQAMADEGLTGTAALRRSAELTRHNPQRRWLASPMVKILALLVVVGVISYLVSLVIQLPVILVQVGNFVRKAAAGEDVQGWTSGYLWLQVPLTFLASLVNSVVSIYGGFAFALLFFDLRARREGPDLRRAVAEMTAGTAPEPPNPAPLPPLAPPAFPGGLGPAGPGEKLP